MNYFVNDPANDGFTVFDAEEKAIKYVDKCINRYQNTKWFECAKYITMGVITHKVEEAKHNQVNNYALKLQVAKNE